MAWITPIPTPAATSHAVLMFVRNSTASAVMPISTVKASVNAVSASSTRTPPMSPSDATVTPARNARAVAWRRIHGTILPSRATKMNDGRKIPTVASRGAGRTVDLPADEGRRREHRAGCDLAHGDSVEQLLAREPAEIVDETALQERDEHVPTAVEHAADLQEDEEQPPERHGRDRHRRER